MFRLIQGDYRMHSRVREDTPVRRRLLALPRMLLNPSLHAVVLIRLSNASPRSLHWLWRNILIWKHSIDVSYRPVIGPGLILPHPLGIVIGPEVLIGRNVMLQHNITLGTKRGTLGSGTPVIEDEVTIFPGSVVIGDITVGQGATIGANSLIDEDVEPHAVIGKATPSRHLAASAGGAG